MRRFAHVVLLFIAIVLAGCAPAKSAPAEAAVFSVDLDGQVTVGTPISFEGGSSLADELQWLAVQTACIGIYNNAQAGNYTLGDPTMR
jgi:hypothetical protein